MNLIPIIKSALTPLAPTSHNKYRGVELTYITFFEYLKQTETAADDKAAANGRYWQIDLWSSELDDNDLYDLEQQAETTLINAGFGDITVQDLYEPDTETAHYAIRCYFYEEV